MTRKAANVSLFLIGLFAWTRVRLIGMIGISEIVCILAGPFLFLQDYASLRRHGYLPLCWLTLASCAGCLISAFYNGCVWQQWMRGLATPLVVFGVIVTVHRLMCISPDGVRLLIAGASLSGFFTFVVMGGSMSALVSDDAQFGINTAAVMRMYLFGPMLTMPIILWYHKIPSLMSALAMIGLGVLTVLASASGRAQSLIYIGGGILLIFGGKSVRKMRFIRKNFMFYAILGVALVCVAKVMYSHAALAGTLGEEARRKYEHQTREGSGIIKLLVGGRAEVFCGLMAAIERPVMGYGSWAADTTGVYERFLAKYGNAEDYEKFIQEQIKYGGNRLLPAHSHIIGYWLWYGVVGLVFWLYVFWLVFQYFRRYIDVVPQWFGLMVLMVMPFLWHVFFSPFSTRIATSVMMCALLHVRAFALGAISMPSDMLREKQSFLR